MGTEATERGHLRKLQVMVFSRIADLILCGLADASGHHSHLVSVGHVRPLASDGGGVGLSVCALSFSPGDLQTFAHQDFRHPHPISAAAALRMAHARVMVSLML